MNTCVGLAKSEDPSPYPQRTHILRLLDPKTLLYKAFGLFGAKGSRESLAWGLVGVPGSFSNPDLVISLNPPPKKP